MLVAEDLSGRYKSVIETLPQFLPFIEIEIKEGKQDFGLAKRNKNRYYAQQMVMLLSALAHNVMAVGHFQR